MPEIVTIEGSINPSVELPRGERRTVALTEKVQRHIDRGYVVVVDQDPDDQAPAPKKKAAKKAAAKKATQSKEATPDGDSGQGDVPGNDDQPAAPGSGDGADHSADASPADAGDQERSPEASA